MHTDKNIRLDYPVSRSLLFVERCNKKMKGSTTPFINILSDNIKGQKRKAKLNDKNYSHGFRLIVLLWYFLRKQEFLLKRYKSYFLSWKLVHWLSKKGNAKINLEDCKKDVGTIILLKFGRKKKVKEEVKDNIFLFQFIYLHAMINRPVLRWEFEQKFWYKQNLIFLSSVHQ